MASQPPNQLRLVQWLFPVQNISKENESLPAKLQMKEFEKNVSHLLTLLPPDEQAKVLKYFFPHDAKMSLGSQLLKHLFIKELCDIPWRSTIISVADNGKPCYNGLGPKLEFNVSHQAGLVALIGARSAGVDLGIDIVCVNERDDFAAIDSDGLFAWIDMHADVFAPSEIDYLKHDAEHLFDSMGRPILQGSWLEKERQFISACEYRVSPNDTKDDVDLAKLVVEAKLRRFYALWCLRETYVKMTGEALLALWLQKLEFRAFGVPPPVRGVLHSPTSGTEGPDSDELVPGGVCDEFEIWFEGERVRDTKMRIQAFGGRFMVASAIRHKDRRAIDGPDVDKIIFPDFSIFRSEGVQRQAGAA